MHWGKKRLSVASNPRLFRVAVRFRYEDDVRVDKVKKKLHRSSSSPVWERRGASSRGIFNLESYVSISDTKKKITRILRVRVQKALRPLMLFYTATLTHYAAGKKKHQEPSFKSLL
ncbi:hypothetical protein EVAR_28776_1 [Eumeta japonica]|uniref:Uncharacterized protein n=1 Tax=Eumeta variegata TaxID=151549 RepID=A0A4C1VHX6_EUMVA|nr:hypothetical protein EVAR_28776_1 [Eumeta japonica]